MGEIYNSDFKVVEFDHLKAQENDTAKERHTEFPENRLWIIYGQIFIHFRILHFPDCVYDYFGTAICTKAEACYIYVWMFIVQ